MNTESPIAALQSALSTFINLGSEIQNTQASLETSTADRAERLKSADFNDPKALDEISRLHVKIDLIPLRIVALEELQTAAQVALIKAANTCISKELSPRRHRVRQVVESQVRAELKSHFAEEYLLDRAVLDSQRVRVASNIGGSCSLTENPANGATRFAEQILSDLASLEKLEATLK